MSRQKSEKDIAWSWENTTVVSSNGYLKVKGEVGQNSQKEPVLFGYFTLGLICEVKLLVLYLLVSSNFPVGVIDI